MDDSFADSASKSDMMDMGDFLSLEHQQDSAPHLAYNGTDNTGNFSNTYSDNSTMSDGFDMYDYMLASASEDNVDLPKSVKSVLIFLYVAIILAAIVGNLLVILVVVKYPKMRSVTNMFLVSLAISDTLIASLNMPVQLKSYIQHEWTLGEPMCKLSSYVQGVVIIASILTLVGIAIDRYYAICYPLRALHVHTLGRAMVIISVFWVVSLLLMIPQLLIQRIDMRIFVPETAFEDGILDDTEFQMYNVCVEYFSESWHQLAYTLFFYIVLYLFPVVTMLVTYTRIARTLWSRRPIGEFADAPQETTRRVRQNKRVVRMLVVIVILFVVNWFPFFTAQIYLLTNRVNQSSHVVIMAFLQLLGYSNSCVNPVVYCFMNESFRKALISTVCCRCFRRHWEKPRRRSCTSLQPVVTTGATNATNVSVM